MGNCQPDGSNTRRQSLVLRSQRADSGISELTNVSGEHDIDITDENVINLEAIIMPEIDSWRHLKKKVMAYIAKHVFIIFKKASNALGYKYRDEADDKWKQKFNVTAEQLVQHINTLPYSQRRDYAQTFGTTMSLASVLQSFTHKHDVEQNTQWKQSLDHYLKTLKLLILRAIRTGHLNKLKLPAQIRAARIQNMGSIPELSAVPAQQTQIHTLQNQNEQKYQEIARLRAQLAAAQSDTKTARTQREQLRKSKAYFEQKSAQLSALVPLQTRKDSSNCKRPRQVEKYRVGKYFEGIEGHTVCFWHRPHVHDRCAL